MLSDVDESSNDSTCSRRSNREPPQRAILYFHVDEKISIESDIRKFIKTPIVKNQDYEIKINNTLLIARVVKVGGSAEEVNEVANRFDRLIDAGYTGLEAIEECENEFVAPKKKKVSRRQPLSSIANTIKETSSSRAKTTSATVVAPPSRIQPLFPTSNHAEHSSTSHTPIAEAIEASMGLYYEAGLERDYLNLMPPPKATYHTHSANQNSQNNFGNERYVPSTSVGHGRMPIQAGTPLHQIGQPASRIDNSTLHRNVAAMSTNTAIMRGSSSCSIPRVHPNPPVNLDPPVNPAPPVNPDPLVNPDPPVNPDPQGHGSDDLDEVSKQERIKFLEAELSRLRGKQLHPILSPGYNLRVSDKDRIECIANCNKDPAKLQRLLIKAVFPEEYLKSHCGGGQRLSKGGNPAADPDKLGAISVFVAQMFMRTNKRLPPINTTFNNIAKAKRRNEGYANGKYRYPISRKKKRKQPAKEVVAAMNEASTDDELYIADV